MAVTLIAIMVGHVSDRVSFNQLESQYNIIHGCLVASHHMVTGVF